MTAADSRAEAIVRAPLTGVVLMVEMTGNYGLVLPLVAGDQLTVIIAAHSVAAVRLLHQGVGVA